jgi:hypothetical protein
MFPDNPEINEMIDLLKTNREDGQKSEIRSSRIGLKKATVKASDAMPMLNNKTTQRKSEDNRERSKL